jgi:hypothetical protein
VTEGAKLRVEVVREALAEAGRDKLAKVRATDAPVRAGPGLRERIGGVRELLPGSPDGFEAAGWSELLEQARTGELSFPGGALRMSLTPAMTCSTWTARWSRPRWRRRARRRRRARSGDWA